MVKYGGNAMTGSGGTDDFSQDIVLMKQTGIDPVVVHGGGPQIGAMLKKLDIQSRFIDGLRVTDEAAVEVVEMVLTGSINKHIVTAINAAGGRAVGLSGKDGNMVVARKLALTKTDSVTGKTIVEDLGFVGEPERVNPEILHTMMKSEIIPVIAPIGVGPKGETYNINADTVAGAVAGAVKAERLILLTDVEGVLDQDKKLIPHLTVERGPRPDRGRHHFRRHDPQDQHRHRRGGSRRACGGDPGRPHSPCAAARIVHRAWRRNPDHGRMTQAMRRWLAALAVLAAICASPRRPRPRSNSATAPAIFSMPPPRRWSSAGSSTQGWTRIAPGDCQVALPEKLTAQSYLVYARSALAHSGPQRAWGGNFPLLRQGCQFHPEPAGESRPSAPATFSRCRSRRWKPMTVPTGP